MNTMVRQNMLLLIFLCFGNIHTTVVSAADAEDEYKDVVIQTIEVRDGIYMLTGRGGNIGVATGNDGVFLIDDQFAPLTGKIKAAIAQISDKPIRFLINTHWHFDHTGGNENLGKAGVIIVAHDNVYRRMSKDSFIDALQAEVPAAPREALPLISFSDSVTFRLNSQEIHVSHYEHAHTDGDCIVYFKEANVIHTGDIWFHDVYPFIDVQSGGSIDGVIKSVERILKLADDNTMFIPGHGPLGNKKELKTYHDTLITLRGRMQKLIDAGKTLDEIKAMKPNADYDATYGKGFLPPEKFLEILYSSMSGSN